MIRRAVCIMVAGFAVLDRTEALTAPTLVAVHGGISASGSEIRLAQGNTSPTASDAQRSHAAELLSTGNPLWAIPLRQLSATRDRPLFSPNRRPAAPPPTIVAAPPPPPPPKAAEPERPQLTLIGTIIGANERLCVFLDQASKNAIRLRMGENHQGWMLKAVSAREAAVQKNDTTVVIALPAPGEGASPRATLGGTAQNPRPLVSQVPTPSGAPEARTSPPAVAAAGPPQADAIPTSGAGGANLDAFRRGAAKISASPPPLANLPPFGSARDH